MTQRAGKLTSYLIYNTDLWQYGTGAKLQPSGRRVYAAAMAKHCITERSDQSKAYFITQVLRRKLPRVLRWKKTINRAISRRITPHYFL